MYKLPAHLPNKLTICYWGWDWITFGTPGEAWDDVERAMLETKERGFNCVRAEAGPDWMFDDALNCRGIVEFCTPIIGGLRNCHCINEKGGGKHDVYERVICMFKAAKKHGMFIIPTTWQYQDSNNHLADPALRACINAIPPEQRMMHIAKKSDFFINRLKELGLADRIAFYELYNEINCDFPEDRFPKPQLKSMIENAYAYVIERHPDILFSADYATFDPEVFADNSQVVDHHRYTGQIMWEAMKEAGVFGGEPDPVGNAFLKQMLRQDAPAWEQHKARNFQLRDFWQKISYFYENLDVEKYDFWCFKVFGDRYEKIIGELREPIDAAGAFASERGLPCVIDEGYIFYPPFFSRFEQSAAGRRISEDACDICIKNGYWGYLFSGYTRPNTVSWHDADHISKVRAINEKFLKSGQ